MRNTRTLPPRTLPLVLLSCLLLTILVDVGSEVPARPAPGWQPVDDSRLWEMMHWQQTGSLQAPPTRWQWPLAGRPRLVRAFAPPPQPWLPGHRGVDLAGPTGSMVLAAGDGTVSYAGTLAGRGVVSIEHATGLRTTYEPVSVMVRAGDQVTGGTPIGVLDSGHAGCPATAPDSCLHWGLRRGDGDEYLDPLVVLGLGRVRLLPVTG